MVTGAGSGIGLAATEQLRAAGADVVAVDWSPAGAPAIEACRARFVQADVSRRDGWETIAAAVAAGHGPLSFGFLNAGIHLSEPDVLAVTDETFDRIVGVNVRQILLGLQALAPLMTGGGDIVANASVGGLIAYRDDPVYAMTKHAVIGLARSAARSLEAGGVRLHTLCPGVVDTPILPDHIRAAVVAAGLKPLPPAEVATAALALAGVTPAGRIWVIQPGSPLAEYRFAPPPS